jgi:5-methylcytosine-specific restriction protein A
MRWRPRQPPPGHPDLLELSDLLQRLTIHPLTARLVKFRNANGARRKVGDFTNPDPNYMGKGTDRGRASIGSGRGSRTILSNSLQRFSESRRRRPAKRPSCRPRRTSLRRSRVGSSSASTASVSVTQGSSSERSSTPSSEHGPLACEACGLDFAAVYGELGDGFIECHHTVPLALGSVRKTSLADLALVCSNCHRMLHRSTEPLAVEALRSVIEARRARSGVLDPAPQVGAAAKGGSAD